MDDVTMEREIKQFTNVLIQMKNELDATDMARDICGEKDDCKTCVGKKGDIYFKSKLDCKYYRFAEAAVKKGYVKITEDTMVITREEVKVIEKVTAREILQALFDGMDRHTLFMDDIMELAEKYGVEVKK